MHAPRSFIEKWNLELKEIVAFLRKYKNIKNFLLFNFRPFRLILVIWIFEVRVFFLSYCNHILEKRGNKRIKQGLLFKHET